MYNSLRHQKHKIFLCALTRSYFTFNGREFHNIKETCLSDSMQIAYHYLAVEEISDIMW